MAGKTDIEISLAKLDRVGPVTKRVRDEIDRKKWRNQPAWSAEALKALNEEDRDLEAQLNSRLDSLNADGRHADADPGARTLRAARLRLRETIAEVSGVALEVCPSSPPDVAGAVDLLMRQRAEFWSARTGFGAHRDTLYRMPRPRGRKLDFKGIGQEADVLAALAMAENAEGSARILEEAAKAGMCATALKAQHEGEAVVEEPLEEAVRRRVAVLQEERSRDAVFLHFLLHKGWITLCR